VALERGEVIAGQQAPHSYEDVVVLEGVRIQLVHAGLPSRMIACPKRVKGVGVRLDRSLRTPSESMLRQRSAAEVALQQHLAMLADSAAGGSTSAVARPLCRVGDGQLHYRAARRCDPGAGGRLATRR